MSILNLDSTLVSADLHLGHNLMREQRGFARQSEHDERIVELWNDVRATLPPGRATVYLLGDVGFRCSPGYLADRLCRMKGNDRWILITGNHDKVALKPKCRGFFDEVHDVFELKGACDHPLALTGHPLKIWMSHYYHVSWPSSHWGAVHLYAHSHGHFRKLPVSCTHCGGWFDHEVRMPRAKDVGVDTNGLRPYVLRSALDQIHEVSLGGKSEDLVNV